MSKGRSATGALSALMLAGSFAAGCQNSYVPPNPTMMSTPLNLPDSEGRESTPFSEGANQWLARNSYETIASPSGMFVVYVATEGQDKFDNIEVARYTADLAGIISDKFATWIASMGGQIIPDADGTVKIFLTGETTETKGTAVSKYHNGLYGADIFIHGNALSRTDVLQATVAHELSHYYLMQYGPPFIDISIGNESGHESYATALGILFAQEQLQLSAAQNYLYDEYIQGVMGTLCDESSCFPRQDTFSGDDYRNWPIWMELAYINGGYNPKLLLQYPYLASSYNRSAYNYLALSVAAMAPDNHPFQSVTELEELHALRIALHLRSTISGGFPWYPGLPLEVMAAALTPSYIEGNYTTQILTEYNPIVSLAGINGHYRLEVTEGVIVVYVTGESVMILDSQSILNLSGDNVFLQVYSLQNPPLPSTISLTPYDINQP